MFGDKSLVALSAIGLLSTALAQNTTTNGTITQDTVFYGRSPPRYPSPEVSKNGLFAESVAKARQLVSQMTLEEKVNITGGVTNPSNGCGGNIPAVPRVGFPGLCLQDGPAGVRGTDFVNGYAAGIHTGARYVSHNFNTLYMKSDKGSAGISLLPTLAQMLWVASSTGKVLASPLARQSLVH